MGEVLDVSANLVGSRLGDLNHELGTGNAEQTVFLGTQKVGDLHHDLVHGHEQFVLPHNGWARPDSKAAAQSRRPVLQKGAAVAPTIRCGSWFRFDPSLVTGWSQLNRAAPPPQYS